MTRQAIPHRRRTLLRGLALVIPAILSAVPAAFSAPAGEVFERQVPLAAGGTFSLVNVNGSVHVQGWEAERVEIRAVKTARSSGRDADRVRILVENTPDSVSVRTEYPRARGVDVSVDFLVRVPYRSLLSRVETVNGTVRVQGVEGGGTLRTVNGNIEIFDAGGRFNARSTNGSIQAELRFLPDGPPVTLETVNGSILLALPGDASAELDVRSVNGDFASDLPLLLRGQDGQRQFRGRVGHGGGEVRLRTVNGGIRVVEAQPTI